MTWPSLRVLRLAGCRLHSWGSLQHRCCGLQGPLCLSWASRSGLVYEKVQLGQGWRFIWGTWLSDPFPAELSSSSLGVLDSACHLAPCWLCSWPSPWAKGRAHPEKQIRGFLLKRRGFPLRTQTWGWDCMPLEASHLPPVPEFLPLREVGLPTPVCQGSS